MLFFTGQPSNDVGLMWVNRSIQRILIGVSFSNKLSKFLHSTKSIPPCADSHWASKGQKGVKGCPCSGTRIAPGRNWVPGISSQNVDVILPWSKHYRITCSEVPWISRDIYIYIHTSLHIYICIHMCAHDSSSVFNVNVYDDPAMDQMNCWDMDHQVTNMCGIFSGMYIVVNQNSMCRPTKYFHWWCLYTPSLLIFSTAQWKPWSTPKLRPCFGFERRQRSVFDGIECYVL